MIPRTDDKRVLFAVPWHNKIIVGTTDTPISVETGHAISQQEPIAFEEEIEFVLHHIQKYLTKDPDRSDIRSVFAGLRPLVKAHAKTTAALSRDHLVTVSDSELITVTGGKWTTYRKMAEDVLEIAIAKAGLTNKECLTKDLHIHGYKMETDFNKPLYYYGADEEGVRSIIESDKTLSEQIHPMLPYIKAEILWAVRNEMCMKVEDFLSRRTRALMLDARATIESASLVAKLMAKETNKNEDWMKNEIDSFNSIAKNYLPTSNNKQLTTN
jgi:glycerol-3-phosphate dehydrogenase